jgi:hypothetical protein
MSKRRANVFQLMQPVYRTSEERRFCKVVKENERSFILAKRLFK